KRSASKIESIAQDRALAETFHKHRSKVVEIFRDETNIKKLFTNPEKAEPVRSYAELQKALGSSSLSSSGEKHLLTYTDSDMKASILFLATSLINSVLVEINLQSFEQFFHNLDSEAISGLLLELKSSDAFNSIETLRLYFQHFKSSQYVNYDRSDYSKAVQNNNFVKFSSQTIDNSEYFQGFKEAFDEYKNSKTTRELAHLDLLINIVKVLLRSSQFTPNVEIFQVLMDEFGKLELYNFQSVVYQSIPQYKHRQTVLASPQDELSVSKVPKMAYHVQEAVEQNPAFLRTLIDYHIIRNDSESFKQLLSFYRLDDIIQHEKVLNKSYLAGLMSKSRFIRHKERQLEIEPITYSCEEPLLIPLDTIHHTIKGCIQLEQFQFIDLLFNKIIVHAMEKEASGWQLLVSQSYSPKEFASKIFTKELFKVLLRASTKSDDLGRIMWLMPHLDNYLETHMDKHLTKINANELESSPIDPELINEIYIALNTFGLEGKLVSYNQLLNF
ncbi:uncharacterized protein CANTADRAFT_29611, partial [Suhomyces tanzawaensis NRRL Y-17324]